jgi:hypothetical protein
LTDVERAIIMFECPTIAGNADMILALPAGGINEREYHHVTFQQSAQPVAESNRLAGAMESAGYEPAAFQIDGLGAQACFYR